MLEVLLSLQDSDLIVWESSVTELDTVSLGGSWVIGGVESQGFALGVTEATSERVGGIGDPVGRRYQRGIDVCSQ